MNGLGSTDHHGDDFHDRVDDHDDYDVYSDHGHDKNDYDVTDHK